MTILPTASPASTNKRPATATMITIGAATTAADALVSACGASAFGTSLRGADGRGAAGGGVGQGRLVVFTGHRAGENRLGLAVVVVDDVGDHDGHVVGAAAAQRQFDEAVGAFGDVGDLQGLEDGLVAHRVGQPVRAQQVTITGSRFSHGQGGLDLVTGQRPHDQRSLRVAVRLLRR